ncbi:hypothetical protein V6N13_127785 [Hibiscus sabdariffa]|uniref:Uncharacterized protein n=1 Tax=Hibiscus sabdariffa TaxID=183260 RepID=A0ABR2CDQ1_9ROSI
MAYSKFDFSFDVFPSEESVFRSARIGPKAPFSDPILTLINLKISSPSGFRRMISSAAEIWTRIDEASDVVDRRCWIEWGLSPDLSLSSKTFAMTGALAWQLMNSQAILLAYLKAKLLVVVGALARASVYIGLKVATLSVTMLVVISVLKLFHHAYFFLLLETGDQELVTSMSVTILGVWVYVEVTLRHYGDLESSFGGIQITEFLAVAAV